MADRFQMVSHYSAVHGTSGDIVKLKKILWRLCRAIHIRRTQAEIIRNQRRIIARQAEQLKRARRIAADTSRRAGRVERTQIAARRTDALIGQILSIKRSCN